VKSYLGNSSHREIPGIIQKNNIKRIFLVTNKNSFVTSGVSQYIFQALNDCEYKRFSDFRINPTLEDVKKGIRSFLEYQPDLIIGVGGGSAMDMSKLIHHLAAYKSINQETITGGITDHKISNKLMLIPTTSGSGSEATRFAVVYIDNKKYSVQHNSILPDYSIVDGLLTEKLPADITAYTGIDAISQAIESYWAKGANKKSKSYALKALKYLVPSIRDVIVKPTHELRENMALGAFYAGKAIDISKTTLPHACSYYLTTKYGFPHGHAVGIVLPYFLVANAAALDITPILRIFKVRSALELKTQFITMMKEIGLYQSLEYILKDDVECFINAINPERLKNNPVTFTKEQFTSLFNPKDDL